MSKHFTVVMMYILEGLLQKGHSIEIVCPTPSRGVDNEIKKHYRKIRNEWQSDRKVHIIRFPL